ncbi:MAG TPA: 2-dehydro-3-deoxygalactonokinase [Sphingomonas sp.]|jgi:2-dehydro-3-deoxygalactonokinase|uniref:2-dehydro-3-deoxygalactonokinase n=1 Tax=Sphingomonas sp. TaxID=28214 RepID=UPI002EDA516A
MEDRAAWGPDDQIHGDWGTTRLRLFRVRGGAVIDQLDGPGIGTLTGSPSDALMTTLAPWRALGLRDTHVLLCGMVGSRNGLAEVGYVECPVDVAGWRAEMATVVAGDLSVWIAPGLACTRVNGAPDVMRGEETQIFGAMALAPALATRRHAIALPGTHGKWALVEAGRVIRFQTFLTGELFALLRDRSTLTRAGADAGDGEAGFAAGLARSDAGGMLGALFEARSAQLRLGRSRGWAIGFLSGLAIGHEVREALVTIPDVDSLTLVGDPVLAGLYVQALARHDRVAHLCDGSAAALAGLRLLAEAG